MVKHMPDHTDQTSEGKISAFFFQLNELQSCIGAAVCVILVESLDI